MRQDATWSNQEVPSEPSLGAQIVSWISDNHVGDLASIVGLLVSLIGFAVTATAAVRAQAAAELANTAARSAVEKIRLLETVIDFSTAITLCEEIKTLYRMEEFALVFDRCAAVRKLLIALRAENNDLVAEHQSVIQAAIVYLKELERAAARQTKEPRPVGPRVLAQIARHIDELVGVLSELKARNSEG